MAGKRLRDVARRQTVNGAGCGPDAFLNIIIILAGFDSLSLGVSLRMMDGVDQVALPALSLAEP